MLQIFAQRGSAFGLVVILGAAGQHAAFQHQHQPLLGHKGQGFCGGDQRVRVRIGQARLVHILQPRRQQLFAQGGQRRALDILLRALKHIARGNFALGNIVKKRAVIHAYPSLQIALHAHFAVSYGQHQRAQLLCIIYHNARLRKPLQRFCAGLPRAEQADCRPYAV